MMYFFNLFKAIKDSRAMAEEVMPVGNDKDNEPVNSSKYLLKSIRSKKILELVCYFHNGTKKKLKMFVISRLGEEWRAIARV